MCNITWTKPISNRFINILFLIIKKTEKISGKKAEKYQKIPEKSISCFLTSENSFRIFRGSFGNFSTEYVTILTHFTESDQ
jgi:hypothetical protein